MKQISDQTYFKFGESPSLQLLQQKILERTQNAGQIQTNAFNQLRDEGSHLKRSNQNINQIRNERKLVQKQLKEIKQNKNWFRKFFIDYCCCYCCFCQCCRDCCEEKIVLPNKTLTTTITESEEPEPDSQTIEKMWNKRYEPNNWYKSMDENLRQLQKQAEELQMETNEQNKLIAKMHKMTKKEKKKLRKINNKIIDINI